MAVTARYGVIFTSFLPLRALWWRSAAWKHLGSDSDPMEPGVTNLIVAFNHSPWPCTLGLARVHVALNQKMCSLIEAMESAKECFNGEKGLEAAHYYLTPVYTEAPYILSDAGLQAADGITMIIGVAAVGIVPKDNTVNLTASEGAVSTLVIHHLLHLTMNLVLVPPQLSCPVWTGMRRAKVQYESFIHFPTSYAPPNILESECSSQQLVLMAGLLMYPSLQCCWPWPTNWKISGQYHLGPRLVTLSQGMDIVLRTRLPRRLSQQIPETLQGSITSHKEKS